MKNVCAIHVLQISIVFVFLIIFKAMGYIYAISFATPSIYIFLILPLSIISFVFILVYTLILKKDIVNIYEKVVAILISAGLSLLIAFSGWVYVLAATDLQIFIYVLSFFLVFFEILWCISKNEKVRVSISKLITKIKK